MGQRHAAVKIVGEGLQIHIGGVNVVVDVEESLAGDVTVGDHHGVEALGVGRPSDVHHVLAPDGGLVVGESHAGAAVLLRQRHHLLRLQASGVHLVGFRFRDVPVLAEEATHVAAGRAQRQNLRAGEEVVERLLLDRVNLQRGGLRVAQVVERAAAVHADEAEAHLPVADVAMPRAQVAVQLAVALGFPPARPVRVRWKDGSQIRHRRSFLYLC